MFGGLVDQAIFVYCTRKNKTPDELIDEEEQRIMERMTQVVNETLLETVMQGQQFTQVNNIAHKYQTHEDFGGKRKHRASAHIDDKASMGFCSSTLRLILFCPAPLPHQSRG